MSSGLIDVSRKTEAAVDSLVLRDCSGYTMFPHLFSRNQYKYIKMEMIRLCLWELGVVARSGNNPSFNDLLNKIVKELHN